MRAEIHGSGVASTRSRTDERWRSASRPRQRARLDRFDLLVLIAFGAVSLWVLALDVYQAAAHGRVWTGTDGIYLTDQMQYLAWIRAASHHLLASNLFVLRGTPADYFQPAIVISGALTALGVPPWVSLLLWKPVAVIAAFFAIRGFVRLTLEGTWERRAGLVLGLFFGSFTIIYGSVGVLGDLFPAFLSWGYQFGLLALAVTVLSLVTYDRARRRRAGIRNRAAWTPALLGALASLLHPWQGELLILIVASTELVLWRWDRRSPRPIGLAVLTVAVTAAPLLYYLILGRADLSWRLGRVASKHSFSLATILLGIAPLLLPALLAWRPRRRSFMEVATRAWPLAALAIYLVSATSLSATPLHAFDGVTLPLVLLAIEGVRRAGLARLPLARPAAVLAVGAGTIPATVYMLQTAATLAAPQAGNANFIARDENRALRYLAKDRDPGGVLTRFYLGVVVPAETGRRTYVGSCLWSQPGCNTRAEVAQALFDGTLTEDEARTFVRQSGARFVLADCDTTSDVETVLGPLIISVSHFGCATVYELDTPGPPTEPLAESSLHAALRAPGRQQRRVQSI